MVTIHASAVTKLGFKGAMDAAAGKARYGLHHQHRGRIEDPNFFKLPP
jgi:hypothetical protein